MSRLMNSASTCCGFVSTQIWPKRSEFTRHYSRTVLILRFDRLAVGHIGLGSSALRHSGLDPNERLLPESVVEGERLLSEFFCFPEKFLSFELYGLREAFRESSGTAVEIDFYLSAPPDTVPRRIDPRAVRLNCSPAINLFDLETTPVELKERTDRVAIEADPRNPTEYQIHALNRVSYSR